jgi:hypothetical protein
MERTDGISPTAKAGAIMTKEKLCRIAIDYPEEERKGWYSYELSGRSLFISRDSEPHTAYSLSPLDGFASVRNLVPVKENKDVFSWEYDETRFHIPIAEVPDHDDYHIIDRVSYPYTAMILIRQLEMDPVDNNACIFKNGSWYRRSELKERYINQRALNNISVLVNEQERLSYSKRCGTLGYEPDKEKYLGKMFYWSGIGPNTYGEAEFRLDEEEFDIMTSRILMDRNKHRLHFHEPEFLFPYKSAGFDPFSTLYVSTSSALFYTGKALKDYQIKLENDLRFLLNGAGIMDYEIVRIRNPYKRRSQ